MNFSYPAGATNYRLRAEVYLPDGSSHYPQLLEQREAIEASCDLELYWEELEGAYASRIAAYLDPADPSDSDSWPRYRQWGIETLGKLRIAFDTPIKNLS